MPYIRKPIRVVFHNTILNTLYRCMHKLRIQQHGVVVSASGELLLADLEMMPRLDCHS